MKIIGISGKKHSGKDTVARIFREILSDVQFRRIAFADALKEEVAAALGISVEEIERDKDHYRGILQWWGTEWRRQQDQNYWVKRLAEKYERAAQDGVECVLVTDVRFHNEYAWVRANEGSTLIRVNRPSHELGDAHSSEMELDAVEFDYKLTNVDELPVFEMHCARFANAVLVQRLGLAIRR